MRFVQKSCGDNEILLRIATLAWPYHLLAWGLLIVALCVAVAAVATEILIVLPVAGVMLVGAAATFLHIRTTEFGVTNRRVIYKTGVFAREVHEVSLTSLDETEMDQGFVGLLTNFGRLRLWGSGRGELRSPIVQSPVGLRTLISDARARIIQPDDLQPGRVDADLSPREEDQFLAPPGRANASDKSRTRLGQNPARAVSSYD